ncbi:MAG: asparagine synthetase B [Anaerolineales bacterium]|nr:asparagine synthase B [Anaerolineae bacterium]PWB69432.1 MAG: asparagine synthetase B [Anaerolineales bacterium]
MCGIAGVFQGPARQIVKTMVKSIAHRGPDGQGVTEIQNGTLGHTRLAILDVERGHQPMDFQETSIVFNGEIYNYRELKRKYLPDLHVKTHSDTEVLIHLYRKMGPKCVKLLDGMFAFAILHKGEFFLARDPIGIKPLYYGKSANGGQIHFASEIKALVGQVAEIREFPAGYWYHSRRGWHNYYQLEKTIHPFDGAELDALPVIKSMLRSAVYKRLLADVPVGVSLSGGLDSSIVTTLAREETEQLHSFAVGVEGSPDLEAARQMSRHLDTVHHEYVYSTQDMVEALPHVLYHLESFDPALVRSAIPNYFLAKLASQYVKVILTGEGADEIFAGYDYLARYETPDDLQDEMIHITKALHNTNLQRADRMSMAFGLEARVPFLDVKSVSLAMGIPADWKLHHTRTPKALLRQSFAEDLPLEIVNRPKAKFSKGAGSSELIAQEAVEKITDQEFASERDRLKKDWDHNLQNKEALYYYRILREYYDDGWILPNMGKSRSL